jgi:hypothetical protein
VAVAVLLLFVLISPFLLDAVNSEIGQLLVLWLIAGWNERATPFTWTKPADELLTQMEAAKTKASGLTVH